MPIVASLARLVFALITHARYSQLLLRARFPLQIMMTVSLGRPSMDAVTRIIIKRLRRPGRRRRRRRRPEGARDSLARSCSFCVYSRRRTARSVRSLGPAYRCSRTAAAGGARRTRRTRRTPFIRPIHSSPRSWRKSPPLPLSPAVVGTAVLCCFLSLSASVPEK